MKTPLTIVGWYSSPVNGWAWAIGTVKPFAVGKGSRFHIRRVVWGRLLAREEKRDGETIKRVRIFALERAAQT